MQKEQNDNKDLNRTLGLIWAIGASTLAGELSI